MRQKYWSWNFPPLQIQGFFSPRIAGNSFRKGSIRNILQVRSRRRGFYQGRKGSISIVLDSITDDNGNNIPMGGGSWRVAKGGPLNRLFFKSGGWRRRSFLYRTTGNIFYEWTNTAIGGRGGGGHRRMVECCSNQTFGIDGYRRIPSSKTAFLNLFSKKIPAEAGSLESWLQYLVFLLLLRFYKWIL